ncbi:hypothetical protein KDA_37490 [Dictyobacter alpinus]|uniref:non-specific serine/threonine protein kinase n=1 Tax=Dictyobacter alpinus TaxID=2014873 RepID=A0A402BA87_9CHLR|nr:serine/threonine-protein kinase [Dictyobacter alpinus]GCE28265.1 hypothetical protein KDA_37490 [Dictyobacter alpinus]
MADRIGQRLGNYTIKQLLGQGGFAEVYLGEHLYLKSLAAIKILQTRLSGSDDTDSFLTEAQTIARLSHPNIVRVMDFGIDGETPYLVMDYAPNGTLRQRHARGNPLPLATILPYVQQVADALQYAHDEHIIHRDIKPENMLLGKRNEVLLSDFGIALVAQSSRYQGTQDVIGTVAYMSPEQIQGKPRPASDQYSLAIVVYEWLTGNRPFHGSFTEMCTQHMFAAPPPIREKLPNIAPEVEQAVMRAMDKDPKKRFEHIKDFAAALQQAGQSYQTELMPPTTSSAGYGTVAMQSNTTNPVQTNNQPGMTPPITAAPYTAMQSQPFGQPGGNATNNSRQTQQEQRSAQAGISQPQQPNLLNQTNQPANTAYSSTTVAQTGFNVGSNPNNAPYQQSQQPNQTPNAGGQFGPQKMILPGQPPQPGYPNGPQQQRPPGQQFGGPQGQRPPQQHYPNMGHAPVQPPYQQRPQQFGSPQQQQGQQFGGPQQGQGYQHPNRPSQFEQQRPAPRPAPPPRQYEDYDDPPERPQSRARVADEPRAARSRSAPEPQESLAEWLGPLNSLKWPIIATVVGIILFCFLHNFRPIIYYRAIPMVLVLPLFFGAAFGPIVGILVGVGGALVADFMYRGNDSLVNALTHTASFAPLHNWWFPLAFYGFAGLLTGLSMLRPRKFPSIGSSIRASLLAVIAMAAALGYILYSAKALRLFPELGIIILANIIVSLIILLIYSIMGRLIDPA